MSERVWDKFLTEQDREVFKAGGFGAPAGYGQRPAVLVIDVNYAFAGDRSEPILDAVRKQRLACGEAAWRAVPVIKDILDAARVKGLPLIYTTRDERPTEWYSGIWARKHIWHSELPPGERPNLDESEIIPEIAPRPADIVIRKQKPSAFFGTPLLSYLVALKVDSLIVTGTTTSGCVRASVIDAFSWNYRCAVVEDASFDRFEASHAVNLFDLSAKYADIVRSEDVIAFLSKLKPGLFDLPT